MAAPRAETKWLLLLQQIPRRPEYLRVKIWRRLRRLGAVAIKHAAYVLPRSEERNEDLQWVMREIVAGGGEATLVEGNLLQGLRDDEVEALFRRARDADYEALVAEVRAAGQLLRRGGAEARSRARAEVARLRLQLDAIRAIDFFHAEGRDAAAAQLDALDRRLAPPPPRAGRRRAAQYGGRVWVTRNGIHVDRMASAWLIRRFIDAEASFKWVAPKGYQPKTGELRFDMFEAEFTHVGDQCTFEVLLAHARLSDRALAAIAEIVHDIDIKDERYQRPETAGVATLVAGIALAGNDDERLARASAVFDQLYEVFSRRRKA